MAGRCSMNSEFKLPLVLLRESENEMKEIPNSRLFNDSQYQKTLEKWAAAIFGLGYEEYVSDCKIKIIEKEQDSADFILRSNNKDFPFQLTERQREGRKRGKLYKEREKDSLKTEPYSPEEGRIKGPQWIYEAVDKKAKKYPDSEKLSLLVHINFGANKLERDKIVQKLGEFENSFFSIWLVTNHQICSVFGNSEVGSIEGWGNISTIIPPQFFKNKVMS